MRDISGIKIKFYNGDDLHRGVFVSRSSDLFDISTQRIDNINKEIMMELYHCRRIELEGKIVVEILGDIFGFCPSTRELSDPPRVELGTDPNIVEMVYKMTSPNFVLVIRSCTMK